VTDKNRWRALVATIAVSAVVNLAATTVFVVTSSKAREQNCDRIAEAFDAYTSALIAAADGADPERVDAFKASYEPRLAECT
jgi:hypothetical protein